jgi:phosphohistidine swiveling domain-containing protein
VNKTDKMTDMGLVERLTVVEGQDGEFPVEWTDPSEADLEWAWDDMHFPRALTTLSGDYMTEVLVEGMNYRYERAQLPVHSYCRAFNGYIYIADKLSIPEDRLPAIRSTSKEKRQQSARELRDYWDNKVLPSLRASYEWMRDAPIETASLPDVADAWKRMWREAQHIWGLHFMVVAGTYQSLDDLSDVYEALIEGAQASDVLVLMQGLSADLQSVQRDLYLLVEHARNNSAVAASIRSEKPLEDMGSVEGGAEFSRLLHAFLDEHGHLGQPFEDLAFSSWGDEPSLIIAEIRKRLDQPGQDPEIQRRGLRSQADARELEIRERLAGRPEDLKRFEAALALAQDVGPLAEDHNYWMDRMVQTHVHRFAMRVGGRLVEANVVAEAGDVFHLHVQEVEDALRVPHDMRATVSERKTDLAKWQAMKPPQHLGKPPSPPTGPDRFSPIPEAQSDANILKGIGACAGVGRGPARVVCTPEDFERVQPGDVLVSPASNPSWVPLFSIIAGLVTNTGGVLAHAAVTAREFSVPAVVGTGTATTVIKDGQMLEVDGAAGIVRILS